MVVATCGPVKDIMEDMENNEPSIHRDNASPPQMSISPNNNSSNNNAQNGSGASKTLRL
jgi:hypothetical protein